MKTKSLFIIILMSMSFFGMAQSADRKTQIQKNERGIIQSVEFSSEDETVRIPTSADEFFNNVLNTRAADRFEKKPHRSKREGFVHEHFEQYYNGVRVEGGGYNFHYRNREMFFAAGTLPFLISGVTLIVYSVKKIDTITKDYNRRHHSSFFQSDIQINFGFTPNGIGMRLSF